LPKAYGLNFDGKRGSASFNPEKITDHAADNALRIKI